MRPAERKLAFERLAPSLDMDAVGRAIRTDEDGSPIPPSVIPACDLDLAAQMVWAAGERWLAEDLAAASYIRVQDEGLFSVPDVDRPVKQVLDLTLLDANRESWVVVDWKATLQDVDSRWGYRQADSWQGKFYLLTTGARGFYYRGVDAKLATREVVIKVSPLTQLQIATTEDLYDTLLERWPDGPWPMSKPRSCWYGNQKCRFYDDCHEQPSGLVPITPVRNRAHLSHSFLTSLLACPEQARREELLGEKRARSYDMDLGRAFDRGVSELWRQAFGSRCLTGGQPHGSILHDLDTIDSLLKESN